MKFEKETSNASEMYLAYIERVAEFLTKKFAKYLRIYITGQREP